MLTHPTLEKLQALKLTGMLSALKEQMHMPARYRRPQFRRALGPVGRP